MIFYHYSDIFSIILTLLIKPKQISLRKFGYNLENTINYEKTSSKSRDH